MDPNNIPPTNPVAPTMPDGSMPPQPVAPMPMTPEQPAPMAPVPSAIPSMPEQPAPMSPANQGMPPMPVVDPMAPAQPAPVGPAPQPMFSPMSPQMPAQPMPGQPMPGQPMPMGAPAPFTPMADSQMPKPKGKSKFFIIGIIIFVVIAVGVGAFLFASKAALIGSLTSDSFEGLNYQRPGSWVKDTSKSEVVSYHPKTSLGKSSGGDPTYALKMNVSAQKEVFQSIPSQLSASDKATLQKVIDDEISQASKDILPSKSEVGCGEDPVFKDKPKKIDVKDAFLAVSYSFTCKSGGSGSSATTLYFKVIDIVPNNKDVEYLVALGAASESIYKSNLTKIDNILGNVSFQ